MAVLGGSAATGHATTTSDLDILIVLSDQWEEVSFVETVEHHGQLVEAFVYGREALQPWLNKGRSERRPVLDRIIAEGAPLTSGALTDDLVRKAKAALAAGPPPAEPTELRIRTYTLSAMVDDLGTTDAGVRYVIAATAWREAAELALSRWSANGWARASGCCGSCAEAAIASVSRRGRRTNLPTPCAWPWPAAPSSGQLAAICRPASSEGPVHRTFRRHWCGCVVPPATGQ